MTKKREWTKRLKQLVAPTPYPGVLERKEGGHVVRARVVDPSTGKMREVRRVLPDEVDAANAYTWLQGEIARIRGGEAGTPQSRQLFCDYSVSLLERKLTAKDIKSASGRERWRHTVRHLIGGTEGVRGFGDVFVDQIDFARMDAWRTEVAKLIAGGRYAPSTANGWLSILCVILRAAKREFDLPRDPTEGVRQFDTSEHATYTDEEPNALLAEETGAFLECLRERFPQHYAMTCLGFVTGLRPSSMRPLRRFGQTPDVRWDERVILVRQSHTVGEVMATTKTGRHQRITVPSELVDVLRWHVDTQLTTPEQKASELLFPAEDGGFRSEACLRKPFAEVGRLIGLKKKVTPRGMRRTFNDLMRIANVEPIVTKSISGHQTERMREHYSSVSPGEQCQSISRVFGAIRGDRAAPSGGDGGGNARSGGGNGRGAVH